MTTKLDSGEFFNPLNASHIPDPDEFMQASRKGCPVGQVSDFLYIANTDQVVRTVFDDTDRCAWSPSLPTAFPNSAR